MRKEIRERIAPKLWDAVYLLTFSNWLTFSDLIKKIKSEKKELNQLKILDLGCGYKPFEYLFKKNFQNYQYVGVDFNQEKSNADIIADLNKDPLPFANESFDVIIVSEVLEHLFNPFHTLQEAVRVLKTGGYLFISTPFVFHYHEIPHDYFRYTVFFYQWLAREYKLEIVTIRQAGNLFSIPFFLFNLVILGALKKLKILSPFRLFFLISNVIILFFTWLGDIFSKIFGVKEISYLNVGISCLLKKKN